MIIIEIFLCNFYCHRALKATKDGLFKDEIIPTTVTIKDQDDNERQITVSMIL